MALDRLEQSGALDLARPKDDVAVREDGRRPPSAQSIDHVQRAWEQTVGKRIVQEVVGDPDESRVARVLGSVAF